LASVISSELSLVSYSEVFYCGGRTDAVAEAVVGQLPRQKPSMSSVLILTVAVILVPAMSGVVETVIDGVP
jgi:hypothetical protein